VSNTRSDSVGEFFFVDSSARKEIGSSKKSMNWYSWEEPASVEKLYFVEQHGDAVRF
jgi:hypothetical protein